MKRFQQQEKGFALLLALIVSSVVLAIGLSILEISLNQISLSATARESELAFQSAHAGVDCIWYWRNEDAASYTSESGDAPEVRCFGTDPIDAIALTPYNSASGHIREFQYTYEWGSPMRCTEVDMFVMNAHTDGFSYDFGGYSEAVGINGVKSCNIYNVCTILVSKGYNRPCDELDAGVFAVQREITVEF